MVTPSMKWGLRITMAIVVLITVVGFHKWMQVHDSNSMSVLLTSERQVQRQYCSSLKGQPTDVDQDQTYCCPDMPCLYRDEVNLRIIILVYSRADSLLKVLQSISKLEMDGDTLSVDIWIDINKLGEVYLQTLDVAQAFTLQQGSVNVHVQLEHVGIYGQWIDSWRPRKNTNELALILEDDVDISPYAYRWLKAAHSFYGYRTDIGGISIYEGDIVHMPIVPSHLVFLHQRVGSQGFAPHPVHWRTFQDWYHSKKTEPTFRPFVADDPLLTSWYKTEIAQHRDTMWDMWWTYHATVNNLWILYPSIGAHMHAKNTQFTSGRYLAYHRRESGLHFHDQSRGSTRKLIIEWNSDFIHFPKDLSKYLFNATRIE